MTQVPVTEGYAHIVAFADRLRSAGLPVSPAAVVDCCHAVLLAGPVELYWSGRLTLVTRPQDLPVYDSAFMAHFGTRGAEQARTSVTVTQSRSAELREPVDEPDSESEGVASAMELLRHKDFAALSADEVRMLSELVRALDLRPPPRRSRRWRAARRGRPDMRGTVRAALRTAGEPLVRRARVRRTKARNLIVIMDVSHSMADYARALLMLAHAGLRSQVPMEVFCFGTRLTRLTTRLSRVAPEEAFIRAAELVLDWDGGTRIGESLKEFLNGYGHAGLARGCVAVICSDGLETGDPGVLGEQMARLSRLAYRVVWLNPLSASASYEPLARGMRVALPHVDLFASGHNIANLEALAGLLAEVIDPTRRECPTRADMP